MNARSFSAALTAARPLSIGAALLKTMFVVAGNARTFFYAMVNRRVARKMKELPDWQLADIGLSRQDLREVLSKPLGSDPIGELAHRARLNCMYMGR